MRKNKTNRNCALREKENIEAAQIFLRFRNDAFIALGMGHFLNWLAIDGDFHKRASRAAERLIFPMD